jgi:putative ABC transport system permease protein
MITLTLRALRARPLRLAMSTIAVTLAVGFLAGVMVFSHGLDRTFHGIVDGSTPDAVVRADYAQGLGETAQPGSALDPALVSRLAALPQVARADGQVQALGLALLGSDGTAVGGGGGPTIAVNHDDAPNMDGGPMLRLQSGRWPSGPSEVALDAAAAKAGGYHVGDRVSVLVPTSEKPRHLTLTGIADFSGGGTAGSTLVVLSTRGAQDLLLDGKDVFTRIALTAAPGVSQQQVVDAARALVPPGYLAVTGATVTAQAQELIGGFLDAISVFLLIFAVIAVVVAAFIIVNTFTILVAQRTQELALLRALGASRRQVGRSVLLEALVVGLVASTLGAGVGWLLARTLAAVFASLGLTIARSALVLTPTTIGWCYAVGIGVTVAAAYLPARRAGRVPPIAALRSEQAAATRPSAGRVGLGVLAALAGAGCASLGIAHPAGVPGARSLWVGIAGIVWLVAAAALTPTLARPLLWLGSSAYGRVFGMPGRLAADNARRDPRRTGATASALMIGLALVSTIAVLAASLNATIAHTVDQHFSSDFRVEGVNRKPFPTTIGDRVAAVPGVATVSREQELPANYPGGWLLLAGVDDDYFSSHGLREPASGPLAPGTALATRELLKRTGLEVGQTTALIAGDGRLKVRIVGVADGPPTSGELLVPLATLARAGVDRQDNVLTVVMAPGADVSRVRSAIEQAAEPAPYVAVYDKHEFSQQLHDHVDKLMNLIYGLLALAIVIAVLGIVNTLSLSVFERTRELGLLRAVGMTRAQVRRMVTLESVAIALLGAVLGIGLGVLVGVLLRQALSDDLTALGVPVAGLVGFAAVAVVIGVLAAVGPSIRAGRMRPLEAATDG